MMHVATRHRVTAARASVVHVHAAVQRAATRPAGSGIGWHMRRHRRSVGTLRECMCTTRQRGPPTLSFSCDIMQSGDTVPEAAVCAQSVKKLLPIPGRCRICRAEHPSQRKIADCLRGHGVKLAPAKSGKPARRKRAGKREALRAAHPRSSTSNASQQSSKMRDDVTVAAAGSRPASGLSTAGLTHRSPHMSWVNPDFERQAPGQGRATAHQK